jgi:hypothetical protein
MLVVLPQKRLSHAQSRVNAMIPPLLSFIQERTLVLERCTKVGVEHEADLTALRARVDILEHSAAETLRHLSQSQAREQGLGISITVNIDEYFTL